MTLSFYSFTVEKPVPCSFWSTRKTRIAHPMPRDRLVTLIKLITLSRSRYRQATLK